MTVDPEKRPSATEALSHYWILNRFIDLKSDNILLDDGEQQEEDKQNFLSLVEAQNNMASFKKFFLLYYSYIILYQIRNLVINIKDIQKDKELAFAVNSPLITGNTKNLSCESPLMMNNTPFLKNKFMNKNDLSLKEKNQILGKYGFVKPLLMNESHYNFPNSNSNSFHLEPFSADGSLNNIKDMKDEAKSPSKFSISKKNNQVFKLNFPEEQQCQTEEPQKNESDVVIEHENEKNDNSQNIHKRHFSTSVASNFQKFSEKEKK